MQENFVKFKRRVRKVILIKCLIVGLSSALASIGAILLACKLTGNNPLFCLIGLVCLFIGFGLSYLFLRTDDKKTAKMLDKEFNLHEKAQTMVEYGGEEGTMVNLQRADALEKMGDIPVKKLRFKNLCVYILIAVLSLGLFVASIAVPSKDSGKEYDPPRDITDWEWQALDELIDYVKTSDADEEIMKPRTVESLTSLRNILLKGVSENSLKTFVSVTVSEVENILLDANSVVGIEEAQANINTEVKTYVVDKLYEIFDLIPPTAEEPSDDNKDDDEQGGDGSGGTGAVVMGADEKFFDPEKGYVKYSEVIGKYYEDMNDALERGLISKEEWESFLISYFEYLYGTAE